MLEDARSSGVRLTCDRYPYIASSTDLDSLLPAWTYEGGNDEELKRLMDPVDNKRIRQEMQDRTAKNDYWKTVIISSVDSEKNAWMEGMTVSAISASLGLSEIDTFFRILIEEKLRVGAIFLSMSEENLKKFLSLPYCMIGSDSSARSFDGPTRKGKPHARGFGTFPRFLGRYAGDNGTYGTFRGDIQVDISPCGDVRTEEQGAPQRGDVCRYCNFRPEDHKGQGDLRGSLSEVFRDRACACERCSCHQGRSFRRQFPWTNIEEIGSCQIIQTRIKLSCKFFFSVLLRLLCSDKIRIMQISERPLIAISTGGANNLPRQPELYLQAVEKAGAEAVFIGPDDEYNGFCEGLQRISYTWWRRYRPFVV